MHILDLEQGSQEWLEFRRNHIGASDAPVIMGLSPYSNPLRLWGEKVGLIEEKKITFAMQRGKDVETRARQRAEAELGMAFYPKVGIHLEFPWLMASFDGMSNDGTILEIKYNGRKSREFVDRGHVPPYHMVQLQHQMFVANAKKAFYYSFDEIESTILEVDFDEYYCNIILEKEKEFWNKIETFTPPL